MWREDLLRRPTPTRSSPAACRRCRRTTECPGIDDSGLLATHLTPFISAKGKVYDACDVNNMPPEAGADSAFPPAEIASFTDADGKGSVQFEVRTDVENESLGCNDHVKCSIVVVPITGISCDQASAPLSST